MDTDDPLHELVVDAAEFDRTRIVEALRGRLALDESTAVAVVLPRFDELSSPQKVLALLLLRKAAVLLGRAETDLIAPGTAAEQTGIPAGTVRRLLRELLASHQVTQGTGGSYLLSGPQVGSAIESIDKGSAEPSQRATTKPRQRGTGQRTQRAGGKVTKSTPSTRGSKKAAHKPSNGPTALVQDLLNDGFLDEPKTLAEVQRRLKDKSGHRIPVTTLSPIFTRMLRSRNLDREQTSDGVYAYINRKM